MENCNLKNISDLETGNDEKMRIVVRLNRSFWHDKNGVYQRVTLRYLKKCMRGDNLLDYDCSNLGAEEIIPTIKNLNESKDGVYELVICDVKTDEYGYCEDYKYRLIPFNKSSL